VCFGSARLFDRFRVVIKSLNTVIIASRRRRRMKALSEKARLLFVWSSIGRRSEWRISFLVPKARANKELKLKRNRFQKQFRFAVSKGRKFYSRIRPKWRFPISYVLRPRSYETRPFVEGLSIKMVLYIVSLVSYITIYIYSYLVSTFKLAEHIIVASKTVGILDYV
jgi:hypothetical protein